MAAKIPEIPNWRKDPRLIKLDERRAGFEGQRAKLAGAVADAEAKVAAAKADSTAAEAAYVTGDAEQAPLDKARRGVADAESKHAQAARLVDEMDRQLGVLAEIRATIEAQAQADARKTFDGIMRDAVLELGRHLDAAEEASVRVWRMREGWTGAGDPVRPVHFGPVMPGIGMFGRELSLWRAAARRAGYRGDAS